MQTKTFRSERLPHSDPFIGLDKSKYNNWKTTMKIKLDINNVHFLTDKSKIAYVRSRVTELAAKQLVTLLAVPSFRPPPEARASPEPTSWHPLASAALFPSSERPALWQGFFMYIESSFLPSELFSCLF